VGPLRPWAPAKSDLGRNVMRPFLGGIEAGDADRIFVLSVQQSDDDGFQIGRLDRGLSPYPAKPGRDRPLRGRRFDRRRGARSTASSRTYAFTKLHATKPGFKQNPGDSFRM